MGGLVQSFAIPGATIPMFLKAACKIQLGVVSLAGVGSMLVRDKLARFMLVRVLMNTIGVKYGMA